MSARCIFNDFYKSKMWWPFNRITSYFVNFLVWVYIALIHFNLYIIFKYILYNAFAYILYMHVCAYIIKLFYELMKVLNLSLSYFLLLRRGLCLIWNSLCRPAWPPVHRDPPASLSQVLGFKVCVTMPGSVSYFYYEFTIMTNREDIFQLLFH